MAEILDIIYNFITKEQRSGYKDSSTVDGLEIVVNTICDREIAEIKEPQIKKMLEDLKSAINDYQNSNTDIRERKIVESGRILLSLRDAYHSLKKESLGRQKSQTSYSDVRERVISYKQEGKITEAIFELEKMLESRPDDDFALSHLAHIYFQQGRFEEAVRLVDRALKLNPKNPFANTIKGDILFTEGNIDESAIIFEGLINLKSSDVYAYNKLGIIYRKNGKIDDAISILRRGLEISPDNPSLHHVLGDVYSQTGKDEEAILEYQKAMSLDPDDDYAFRGIVSRKSKDKDTKTAILQIQKVLKIPSHSQNPHLHALLASYLRQEKQFNSALVEIQEAVRINPNSIYFQIQMAFCYSKLEQYEKVIEILEPIYKIRSQDTLVAQALAKAYANTNRINEARKILIEILYIYPNDHSLRNALMNISKRKTLLKDIETKDGK